MLKFQWKKIVCYQQYQLVVVYFLFFRTYLRAT